MDQILSAAQERPEILSISLFFLGMIMASFIGVLVDRLPHQLQWCDRPDPNIKIWKPRSHCPKCKHTLGIVELIPVIGWLLNRGRCRSCDVKISPIYPVVEFLSGLATAGSIWVFGWNIDLLLFLLLLWSSIFLSWIDMTENWLPAVFTTPLLWIGLYLSPFADDAEMRILGSIIGGISMYACFMIASYAKKMEVYSGGDVAMMMVGGAWLGVGGLFDFILVTSFLMVLHSIPMRARGEVWIPMGPSLCASLLLIILLRYHGIGILSPVNAF